MMTTRCGLLLLGVVFALGGNLSAQSEQEPEIAPPRNWPAPLYWRATEASARARLTPETSVAVTSPPATPALGPNALVFVAMTPCRVVDTRASKAFPSPFGAPRLAGGASRAFPLPSSTKCGISAAARAYSLNVTVVPPGPLGFLTLFPAGQARPLAATLTSVQGQIISNAAIVEAGTSGSVDVFASNDTELVIDINGYYASPSDGSNTGMGSSALTANSSGFNNTAFGTAALSANTSGFANTAIGQTALSRNTFGYHNTAFGTWALRYNVDGNSDTAVGSEALASNTSGTENVAVGTYALVYNDTGSKNIAIGSSAAYNTSAAASNNIEIGNNGTALDSGIIRIGTPGQQIAFFGAGIWGVTTNLPGGAFVLVDSNGQLGTASSSRRFKEDISDMGDASSGLLRLRPVTFRYKKPYADGSKPLDYGLIAEEVAEIYPDLVSRSADGQIETVQYHKLAPMLLNELQKQQQRAAEQDERIRSLETRLAGLETMLAARPAPAAQ